MELSEKEKLVLGALVQQYILNAMPVSSSLIAKKSKLRMSPATIRNIMAELETKGYIYQPHTSAGRVPRTMAYRVYVDYMMTKARLTTAEKEQIRESVKQAFYEFDSIFKELTRILAYLSQQLGIIVSPKMEQGVFERMELISLSSNRILVVISIRSGFIKTITLEINTQISNKDLHMMSQILNERLHGMKINDIRTSFAEIVKDIQSEDSGLMKLFMRRAYNLFDFGEEMEMHFMGTHNIMRQGDFADARTVSSVVEALENQKVIIHLLAGKEPDQPLTIKIGEEIDEHSMQQCSIISARYDIGDVSGILGVIGPIRMNYSKMISLVDFTAQTLTNLHKRD